MTEGTPTVTGSDRLVSPLIFRVAFAGHVELKGKTLKALQGRLSETFAGLKDIAEAVSQAPVDENARNKHGSETIFQAHAAIWKDEKKSSKHSVSLITGYAEGSDRAAVAAWREVEIGPIHALFPFAEEEQDPASGDEDKYGWTHGPAPVSRDYRISLDTSQPDAPFDSYTVLDGAASHGEMPERSGHLEVTRWLLRWADVVVVAWDGKPAGGVGGTADLVSMALSKHVPVIWIDVSSPQMPARYLSHSQLWKDMQFAELTEALAREREASKGKKGKKADEPANSSWAPHLDAGNLQKLKDQLVSRFRPPSHENDDHHGHGKNKKTDPRNEYCAGPLQLSWSVARLASLMEKFRGLKTLLKKLKPSSRKPKENDPTPGPLALRPDEIIDEAFDRADREAGRLGDLHRDCQRIILLIAVLAVLAGTSPALFDIKLYAVLTEFVLIFIAWRLWSALYQEKSHERWSDVRRLAERLRITRATWPLGIDVRDGRTTSYSTWTEWYAHSVRRAVGPPSGVLRSTRRNETAWAIRNDAHGIVKAQVRYHKNTVRTSGARHKRLECIETITFCALLYSLPVFAAWYAFGSQPLGPKDELAKFIANLVLVSSAVLPAIAAACLAIEAKLEHGESFARSKEMHKRFCRVFCRMKENGSYHEQEELVRSAALLHLTDADRWREAAARRVISTL